MAKIDIEKFKQLAAPVFKTQYFKNADFDGKELEYMIDEMDSDDWDDDENAIITVENLIYSDETKILPKELQVLAHYIYGIAVANKDANRILNYGDLYYSGRIGEQDFKKAEHYFLMADTLGQTDAAICLGYIYYYGRTGEPDYEKAFKYFSKSVLVNDNPRAIYKLGDMFRYGYYVNKNEKMAFKSYQRAEYQSKWGIDEDYDTEEESSVIPQEGPNIWFRLGECYQNGIGTTADFFEALRYYQKAEVGFLKQVHEGNFMLKKMLCKTLEHEQEVRKALFDKLPDMGWAKDNAGYKTL